MFSHVFLGGFRVVVVWCGLVVLQMLLIRTLNMSVSEEC
jgi:hypothetical protein